MVRLYINDLLVHVPKNSTILAACENFGIEIPRFCYQESLSVAGNCRSCLVEVFKAPKPVVACSTPVMKDMKIFTDSPLAKKARESVLEFLLKSHPLDCAICDQGGECDLQEQSYVFGSDSSRFFETKRSVEDKNLGSLIRTIMTRCIHCTRCVRFATEVAGVESLGTFNRGGATEIGSYIERLFDTELSGNVIDLCPVGALTSKSYAFVARPWELTATQGIDFSDSLGSNVIISHKSGQILRVGPAKNDQINGEWISDKARFSFDGLSSCVEKISTPQWKLNSNQPALRSLWFPDLEPFQTFVFLLAASNVKNNSRNLSILMESSVDLESGLLYKTFFSAFTPNMLSAEPCATFSSEFQLNTRLQDINKIDFCSLIGVDPRAEGAILNSLLRKRILSSAISKIFKIGSSFSAPNYSLEHAGTQNKIVAQMLKGLTKFSIPLARSKNPFLMFGPAICNRKDQHGIINLLRLVQKTLNSKVCMNYLGRHANTSGLIGLDLISFSTRNLKTSQIIFSVGFDSQDLKHFSKTKKSTAGFICLSPNDFSKNLQSRIYGGLVTNRDLRLSVLNTQAFPVNFQRQGQLINVEGLCQKIFALEAPTLGGLFSLELKKIGTMLQLRTLIFPKTNLFSIKKLLPQLINKTYPQKETIIFRSKTNQVLKTPFRPIISDFFRTDFVSRNSKTMLLSSIMHRKQHLNYHRTISL